VTGTHTGLSQNNGGGFLTAGLNLSAESPYLLHVTPPSLYFLLRAKKEAALPSFECRIVVCSVRGIISPSGEQLVKSEIAEVSVAYRDRVCFFWLPKEELGGDGSNIKSNRPSKHSVSALS
jgi:hypothetical protein